MYYITKNHPDGHGKWTLCQDGKIVQTFSDSERGRSESVKALTASDPGWGTLVAAGAEENLATWESDPGIAFTGEATSDRRYLVEGEVGFRAFPLPWMLQTVTSWGHDGAVIAGRIDFAEEVNKVVKANGVFDSSEAGKEAERLAANGMLRGVSIDVGYADVEFIVLDTDEDGWPTDWQDQFSNIEVMGATQTPFPAFSRAAVKVTKSSSEAEASVAAAATNRPEGLAAAGILTPPLAWFADPGLTEATPLTITDEGRVFGHIALFGQCHIGYSNSCVTPPKSIATYNYYATGAVKCDSGCDIRTGTLTIGTGHADIKSDARAAAAHYDNTGTAFADVAVGEDDIGIWVAGGVRPGTPDETIYAARASSPSGDWRRLGGNLELVAVLMVNTPGFPVARTAGGTPEALVAALAPHAPAERPSLGVDTMHADAKAVAARFKALEQRMDRLAARERAAEVAAEEALRDRMYGPAMERLNQRMLAQP
jgi:hypothetical protein